MADATASLKMGRAHFRRARLKAVVYPLLLCALLLGVAPPVVAQRSAPPAQPRVTVTPYLLDNGRQQPVMAEWVRLTVDENRQARDSGAVEVAFLRYRTRAAEPGPPIVLLTDSPLSAAADAARIDQFLALTALFGGAADVIMLEPRGVGQARPRLDCPGRFDFAPDRPAAYPRLVQALSAYNALCSNLWRGAEVDLAGYSAAEMAADVDAMRRALGYEQIKVLGIGFGSHVGLTLLKESEESINRAAFVLVLGPDQMLTLPGDVQTQLERLNARVQADPALSAQLPDFLGVVEGVLAELAAAPVTVALENPAGGPPTDVTVGLLDLQYATARSLAQTDQRSLPARYAEMALGDYTWLAEEALAWRGGIGGQLLPALAQCASGASDARQAQVAEQAETALLGNAINGLWFDTCSALGDVTISDSFRTNVESATPVLLISGSMDALTPDANGAAILTGLSNGRHLVVDGASHDLLDEALPLIAPPLVEFMLGDATEIAALTTTAVDLSVPFIFEPVTVQPVAEISGWLGEYFNNRELSGVPVLTRDDETIAFDWGEGAPGDEVTADNFSARWTITRDLPAAVYRLAVRVDGGVRIWINDVPVLDGWEDSGPRNYVVDLNLGRGTHMARVEYFAGTGDAAIEVNFTRVDTFPDWKAEYFDNPDLLGEPIVVRNDETLDFFWGQNSPAAGIPASDWSARWSRRTAFDEAAYRFTIDVAGGVRLWLDGQLLIDSWGDQGPRRLTADSPLLSAGDHDLRVDYFKRSGDGRLQVAWQPIALSAPPQAVIRGPTRAQVSQSIVLDGSGSSAIGAREIVSYSWDWGDGATAEGIQAEHVYLTPGIYNVTLTVTDDAGAAGLASTQIRVDQQPTAPDPAQPPVAVINAPRQGVVGEAVLFDALDSRSQNPIISFGWQFGDGTTANAVSVAKVYRTPGVFNVILTVTDDQGLQSSESRLILIDALPPALPPEGAPVAPTPTPVVPTPLPVTPTPMATPVITATVMPDPNVPLDATPTPAFESTPTPFPPGVPQVTPTPLPGPNDSPLPQPPTDPNAPGTENFDVPVARIQATVNGAPVNIIRSEERGDVVQVQVNQDVFFTGASSSSGTSAMAENGYTWLISGQVYNSQDVNLKFEAPGTYEVTLTVTNQAGFSDTALWFVVVQ